MTDYIITYETRDGKRWNAQVKATGRKQAVNKVRTMEPQSVTIRDIKTVSEARLRPSGMPDSTKRKVRKHLD